jgi:hypothetical protein
MYDNKYSEVIVLSSVALIITYLVLPSFEFLKSTRHTTTIEMIFAKKIIKILNFSIWRHSLFSRQLFISINSIEIHSGRNEVK